MSIPDISGEGKSGLKAGFEKLFVPLLLVVVGVGSYGLGRLNLIQAEKQPIAVHVPVIPESQAASPIQAEKSPSNKQTTPQKQQVQAGSYVAAKSGTVYYLSTCSGSKRIKEENKVWFTTKEAAEKAGYKPAKNCPGL